MPLGNIVNILGRSGKLPAGGGTPVAGSDSVVAWRGVEVNPNVVRGAGKVPDFCSKGHKLIEGCFYRYVGKHKGHLFWRWKCAICHSENEKERRKDPKQKARILSYGYKWAKKNPDKMKAKHRRSNLKQFGLTIETYDEKLRAQAGVCAICRCSCVSGMRLAVDHDHETGRVRGLLCARCNNGIGCLMHDQEILHSAINYLNFHSSSEKPVSLALTT